MKIIATDLDETLFNMMEPFKAILMKRHSARVIESESYNIKTYPEISEDETWSIFKFLYKAYPLCDPCRGARVYLETIYNVSMKPPLIMTSRPEEYASETHAQIKSLVGDMPYHLIIVGTPAEKKYLFADLFDIIVDDRLETVLHFSDCFKKQGIIISRPWNRKNHSMNWYLRNKIIEVNDVYEITPFLRLLIDS
jgi:hypothetical protein